jgi:protein-export membrane protein SecD
VPTFLLIWLAVCVAGIALLIVFQADHHITWLLLISLITAFAVWVSLPDNPGIHLDTNHDGEYDIDKEIAIRQGLDLAGGLKVLLEADLPPGTELKPGAMAEARRIVESRIDSLGALEPVIQQQGERRLIVELPGYEDPEAATALIQETALLEFVDFGGTPIPAGTPVMTDSPLRASEVEEAPTATTDAEDAIAAAAASQVYHTVMTGKNLEWAVATRDQLGDPIVNFSLDAEGARIFGDHTTNHTGEYLGIVLDGVVISSPVIREPITGGSGSISGEFDQEEARRLAIQLNYGALPIPLRVDSTSTVGPTLGQISVEQSIRAGVIGITVVLLFMLIYYRIPGVAAALALIIFTLLNFAAYKLIPVTMTLPAITGFLISVGTAVDGNILIFERLKEELRAGKRVNMAVEAGFERAWTSIRDSNLSTLIICVILYLFGTSFGAGAVRGFAVTLALGLLFNLFTAVTVTRTFLHFILIPFHEQALAERRWLLGL